MTFRRIKDRATTMEGMIESSIELLDDIKRYLPAKAFERSFGIVVLESLQAGFLLSAEMGTGILLRHDRVANKWSAPLAVGITGVGAGISIGLEKKHTVILLTDNEMTQAMSSGFSLRIGWQVSLSLIKGEAFDITAHFGNKGSAVTASQHTSTVGLYCGIQTEGATLAPRTAVNEQFYGQNFTPKKIVFGQVEDMPVCELLDILYTKLLHLEEESVHQLFPTYAETIVHPFLKTTDNTNMLQTKENHEAGRKTSEIRYRVVEVS